MKISSLASNFSIENLLSKPRTSPTSPPNVSDTAPPIVPMSMFLPFPAAMPTPEMAPAATIFPSPSSMLWPVHGWQFFTPIATAPGTKQNAKTMTPPPSLSSTTTGTAPTASIEHDHQKQQKKMASATAASETDRKPGNDQMQKLELKMPTNSKHDHGADDHHRDEEDHHHHLGKMPSNISAFSSLKKACTATVATQFYGNHQSVPLHSLASFNVPSSSSSSSSSSSASAFPINSNAIFGTSMGQNNNNDHSSQQIGTTTTTVTTAPPSTPSSTVFNYGIQQLNAMSSGKRKRRHRTIFTEDQLFLMEEAFINSQYPDVQMREHLADKLKLREERVEVWFKNRRAKERKKTREIQNNQQQLIKSQSMCSSRPSSDGTPKNGHSEDEDESADDSLDTSPMLNVPTKRFKVSAECREQPIEHDKMPHLKQQQQQQQQHVPVAHPQKIVPMPPHPQQMSPMAPQQYQQQQQPFFDFAKCFGTFGTAPGPAVTGDPMLMHQQHLALANSLGVAAAAGGAGGAFMQQMPAAMMAEQLMAFHHSMISRQ
ncbi:hypothetical protein niasHT_035549 [Heterodera trifolii]|uniref:Homeobox domain-containing protein n=1 Tax=Heterodera trifolii TaxID=157864 RepID=A0ABD2IDH8_9BILA